MSVIAHRKNVEISAAAGQADRTAIASLVLAIVSFLRKAISAILAGKHPPELNARKLLDDTRLPLDWNEQRRTLGFA